MLHISDRSCLSLRSTRWHGAASCSSKIRALIAGRAFFHYLLIDKSCSQVCETSHTAANLPGFSSSSLRAGCIQDWEQSTSGREKPPLPQNPLEQLLMRAELAQEPAVGQRIIKVGPQVMEPQLGGSAPSPFHPGTAAEAGFTVLLPRLGSQLPGFGQTTGCCSLAWAWLEAEADPEEGKVNFKSPSHTCVGTCSSFCSGQPQPGIRPLI